MKNFRITPILKVTETCNYKCDFCGYSNQNSKKMMDIVLAKKILNKVFDFNLSQGINNIGVIFHGGEPLLQGIDFFDAIMEFEKNYKDNVNEKIHINNTIQTNGSLITDQWIDFFEKYCFDVGISIDGSGELNFHQREQIEEKHVMDSYRDLKQRGVCCGVLSVITNRHLNKAKQFYEFLRTNEINKVGLCYCLDEENGNSVNPVELGYFLIDLFDLYFDGKYVLDIREFNAVINKIVTGKPNCCTFADRRFCGKYLCFDTQGKVFFCDDILKKEKAIGDIDLEDIDDIIRKFQYTKEHRKAINLYINKCSNCSLKRMCGGGCFRHENEDINYFCETYKIIYPHILKKVKETKI